MNTQPATSYDFNFYQGRSSNRPYELIVEPTSETPFIKYSDVERILMIKGYSMKPDMHHFYHPVTYRVWSYLEDHRNFKLYFFFQELNASTAKVLFNIFKRARLKIQNGQRIEIIWGATSCNEDMLQTGKDFAEIFDLNFKYVVVGD